MRDNDFLKGIACGLRAVSEIGNCENCGESLFSMYLENELSAADCLFVCECIIKETNKNFVREFWNDEIDEYKINEVADPIIVVKEW